MSILKSVLALGLLILLSQTIEASPKTCIDNLIVNSNTDSHNYALHIDHLEVNFENDYLAEAVQAIQIILEKNDCSPDDVNFNQGPEEQPSQSRCENFILEREYARICYVETNLGYFFVTRDLLSNFNIIYSRWD